jgi:membrane protease YdiL (CAAX protease family)
MRPLRSLSVYVAFVFLGGALAAPWLYWSLQPLGDIWPKLAHSPFHRYVDRSLLFLALGGLWPLLKSLGATSAKDIGLVAPKGHANEYWIGLAIGFVSFAFVAGWGIVFGVRTLHISANEWPRHIVSSIATALVVSCTEEILFRGAIFGGLRRVSHWTTALLVSSAIYAIVHFMESARLDGPVRWYSGLDLLPHMLRGFAEWHAIIPGFLNLTAAGTLLGLAYQRTGTLYCSMGIHAGWIFWLKAYGKFTVPNPQASLPFPGADKLTNGWIALPVLLLAVFAYSLLTRRNAQAPNSPITSTASGDQGARA